jgi:GxxExxY protein
MLIESPLVQTVLGSAINVHRTLGPGLLESTYRTCLMHELSLAGLRVAKEVPLPVEYRGVRLECGYRLDLVVEDRLLVETKSVERVVPVHRAQVLTYMKLAGPKQGLLLNFNVYRLKDGIQSFLL